jgi:hypothetical protein
MSIATLKRKVQVKQAGSNSANAAQGVRGWNIRGPFGPEETATVAYGSAGFSTVGTTGTNYIGKSSSGIRKGGTPFRGIHPIGYGGFQGQYVQAVPVMNMGLSHAEIQGNQYQWVKTPSLSNASMLRTRFRWAYSGVYPNRWVQPNTTGPLTDNASQGAYIRTLHLAANQHYTINGGGGRSGTYPVTEFGGRTDPGCRYRTYVKNTHNPLSQSEYVDMVQRPCSAMLLTNAQQPFPPAVSSDTCGQNVVLRSPY